MLRACIRRFVNLFDSRTTPRRRGASKRSFAANIQLLEHRALLSGMTITVNSATDDTSTSHVTLRDAITQANADHNGDTIVFASSLNGQTIILTQGELPITGSMTINGPGASKLTISANQASRVFDVSSATPATLDVTITELNIQGGNGVGANSTGNGGAIYNAGNLTLSNDSISGNTVNSSTAAGGAGIYNSGTLNLTKDTIWGNNANTENGGAIDNVGTMISQANTIFGNLASNGGAITNAGTLTSINDTIVNNRASNNKGGAIDNSGTLTLINNTIAGNSAKTSGGGVFSAGSFNSINSVIVGNSASSSLDVAGTLSTSSTKNQIGIPTGQTLSDIIQTTTIGVSQVPALQDNGGPTRTVSLPAKSPAEGSGSALTAISAAVTATQSTITVGDATYIAVGEQLRINSEIMSVTAISGKTITVARGQAGTTSAGHLAVANVYLATDQRGTARSINDLGAVELVAPVITITAPSVVYTGNPVTATAKVTGYQNASVSGKTTLLYFNGTTASGTGSTTPPKQPGAYTVVGIFTSTNPNYTNATSNPVMFRIEQAPLFTSPAKVTFTVGTKGTFTVGIKGFPAPAFSETGTLPQGITFDEMTGVLSGTPAAGMGGVYKFTITAKNNVGTPASQTFTLTVEQAPAITSSSSVTFETGTKGTFNVFTTGFPATVLTESGPLPTGVNFDAKTGILSGTPAADAGGVYDLTFTAKNGIGNSAVQQFKLTVNQPPVITSVASTTFTTGTSSSFTVKATGFPIPKLELGGKLPQGVTFDASKGILSGTPAAGSGGTYSFSFVARNSLGLVATQQFTLTVKEAPAITSVAATTFTVGSNEKFTLTTKGIPSPTLSETGTLPQGITFDATKGTLSGIPAAGTGGTYHITFKATNGVGAVVTQSFTLTVDQPPAITSAATTTFKLGTAGSFTLTATGFPAPTFSVFSGTLPKGVSLSTTGVLKSTTATPVGTYLITIKATNNIGSDVTQKFTLIVKAA